MSRRTYLLTINSFSHDDLLSKNTFDQGSGAAVECPLKQNIFVRWTSLVVLFCCLGRRVNTLNWHLFVQEHQANSQLETTIITDVHVDCKPFH